MTTVQQFTPRALHDLKAGSIADPITPGLTIEASADAKTWRYKRKVRGTATVFKKVLGTFPKLSIADARLAARGFNDLVENGIDPRAEAKEAALTGMTVGEAHALYIAYVKSGERKVLRDSTIREKEQLYACLSSITATPILSVTDDDLWSIIEAKGETAPTRANRLAAECKVFFSWCWSRRGRNAGIRMKDNPSITLSGSWFAQGKSTRFLDDDEIILLLRALATEGRVYQRAIGLMLLTAGRRNEVLEARTNEYRDGVWSMSGERVKNWKTHMVPLGPWGQALFNGSNSAWVFPSPRKEDGPQTAGWPKVFLRVREKMEELGEVEVPHFTPHDLRRTFRSNTVRLKIPEVVAKACMNHKKEGLDAIYNQYEMLDEKAEAFAMWEAKLVKMGQAAGVAEALGMPSAPAA